MKVIGLWSGGKDSCFACYLAIKAGHTLITLLNFAREDGSHSISHGLSAEIISRQAEHTGIPFLQNAMPSAFYRDEFKRLIAGLKKKDGIEGIVFGDIYLQEHKDWIDKVCGELRVEAIFPVWGRDTGDLLSEIVDAGFKTVIVSTDAKVLGEEWLGREIDRSFIRELPSEIDPCGEKGEFHSFTYAGPLFRQPVRFKPGRKVMENRHWFMEVIPI